MRKTKIICTIGPASQSPEMIREMIEAGMNVCRCNFSHGSYEEQKMKMMNVVRISEEMGKPVATLIDTKGPEIRLRTFEEGKVILEEGQKFTLTTRDVPGTKDMVSVTYENIVNDVVRGGSVLIDDGLLELTVEDITETDIICRVVNGGPVSDKKGVNLPGANLSMPFISEQDRSDILFGIDCGFDFIALSFVRSKEDVLEVRKMLDEKKSPMKIIAKIENMQGINNLDEILEVSDGIMVARGDLGVEIPPEKLPYLQKLLIQKCNDNFKTVITATQMLDSMIRNPRPTRAEVTDVANAVYDGTDAVMLSGETAMGKYPVEALKMMCQICEDSEKHLDYNSYRQRRVSAENEKNISNAVCYSTVSTAHDLEATAIVAPTITGFTTRLLSKWRPGVQIIGLSPSATAVRQMQIYWGVKPFQAKRAESTDILIWSSLELLKDKGVLKAGDLTVVTAGVVTRATRHEPATDTNIMRVVVID